MTTTPQNSAGVKKMKAPGAEKTIKLQENKETSDDKITRYEKYTYTLNGKEVKPDEIAFYDHILKAEIDGKIYKIGIPEGGKVELRENEAVYDQIADLENDLMLAKNDEHKAEIEKKIKALEAELLRESELRSVIKSMIKESLNK